ncbi:hypothetical protein MNEG_15985, partial [Monoraphidium neglectum]
VTSEVEGSLDALRARARDITGGRPAGEFYETTSASFQKAQDDAAGAAKDAASKASSGAGDVKARLGAAADKIGDKASGAADVVKDAAKGALGDTQRAAGRASDKVRDVAFAGFGGGDQSGIAEPDKLGEIARGTPTDAAPAGDRPAGIGQGVRGGVNLAPKASEKVTGPTAGGDLRGSINAAASKVVDAAQGVRDGSGAVVERLDASSAGKDVRENVKGAADKVKDVIRGVSVLPSGGAGAANPSAKDARTAAVDAASGAGDSAKGALESVTRAVGGAGDRVKGAASEGNSIAEQAAKTSTRVEGILQRAADNVREGRTGIEGVTK